MPRYQVVLLRTERILFELEADSPEDAEARFMGEGDEIIAFTTASEVADVKEVNDA